MLLNNCTFVIFKQENYNILINNGVDKKKALLFAICYNLVITKTEYERLKSFAEVSKAAKPYRSICQLAHLGSSMLVLGLAIPRYVRACTEKKEAKITSPVDLFDDLPNLRSRRD